MTFGETRDKIKYRLNNCPFCGSVVLKMSTYSVDFPSVVKTKKAYYVHCDNCGASGPPNLNAESAAFAWNECIPKPNPLDEFIKRSKK
jgi:transcription elongation factor Elf1